MYDVVIVGAGPAGAAAAKLLAEHGKSVVVLEKMALPRNKSCSGLLIKKTIDLVQQYFGATVPVSVQCTPNENRGMVFQNEHGREYRFEQPGLNIWRDKFDYWLIQQAVDSGAVLLDNSPVAACSLLADGRAELTLQAGEKLIAKTAIVCEGAVRGIKGKVLNQKQNAVTTFQTFHTGTVSLDPHYFYAFLQPEFSAYDAWFNVKDDNLIVGVAAKDAKLLPEYHSRFLRFLQDNYGLSISATVKNERWIMPEVMPGCPIDYGVESILFAGESAGFLNPMGEGISCGMESGNAAAKAVLEYLDSGMPPAATYKTLAQPIHSYMLRQWRFVSSIAGAFKNMG